MNGRPAKHAKVAVWRKFAVSQGMPAKVAAETTKRALLDMFAMAPPAPAEPAPEGRERGPVEAGVLRDLSVSGIQSGALGLAALKMARHVDEAQSGAEAAVASREMRMALTTAFSLGKPLSPHSGREGGDEGDGVVVGADRLAEARKRSANARKGSAR